MCGRYTLYTGEQAEEIRQIIDIAQRQANGQLKLGEVFPSDRAPILIANQDVESEEGKVPLSIRKFHGGILGWPVRNGGG